MTTEEFIRHHANSDVLKLALSTPPEGVDLAVALTQIEGRQRALGKLPSWVGCEGIMWPRRLSLEQCSSDATAGYKRLLAEGLGCHGTFADLTAGLGVDCAALAPRFDKAFYVECQEDLCSLARHNLPLLGCQHVEIVCGDGQVWLDQCQQPLDLVMLDPARRNQAGRKVVMLEDCTPNVCSLQETLRHHARWTFIKLSPMLDITAALRSLKGVVQVHVVSVGGECKEVLLVMASDPSLWLPSEQVPVSCVNIMGDAHETLQTFTFTRAEEQQAEARMADGLCAWLYEPHASILKAGGFKLLSQRYEVPKLAPMSHLYTSSAFVADFPGKAWRVEKWSTFQKKDLRQLLAGLDGVELSVRGFPMPVAELRKRLNLKDGGGAHLVATTLANGERVLILVAAPEPCGPQGPRHR